MTSRGEGLIYTFLMRWMSLEWEHVRTSRILTPLGEAIEAAGNTLDRISETDDPEWVESVVADETAVVEDLLGASFVVCQTFITTAVSRVYRAHDIHKKHGNGQPLQTTTRNKTNIVRFGCPIVGGTGYTAVEILDGFANYWKHREEWTRGVWANPNGNQLRTIPIIKAAGAEEGSDGHLRRASEMLGNTTYGDVQIFCDVLGTWSSSFDSGSGAFLFGLTPGSHSLQIFAGADGLASAFLPPISPPIAATPEPMTLLLFGTTAAGLGLARWRRRGREQHAA